MRKNLIGAYVNISQRKGVWMGCRKYKVSVANFTLAINREDWQNNPSTWNSLDDAPPPRAQSSACKHSSCWRIFNISLDIGSLLTWFANWKGQLLIRKLKVANSFYQNVAREKNSAIKLQKLTTGLFWIFRARFAYFRVLRVSSALISAGLTQAGKKVIQRV